MNWGPIKDQFKDTAGKGVFLYVFHSPTPGISRSCMYAEILLSQNALNWYSASFNR